MSNQATVWINSIDKDDFYGFEYQNNLINIYVPVTLGLFEGQNHKLDYDKDKELIKLLALFIRSFKLSACEDLVNDKSLNSNEDDSVEYPYEAYQFIIEDYRRNGRYIEFETKQSINGNGKIDWKRTLQKQPYISNGQPTYLELVTKQKQITENIMNDIYLLCVYESIYKFGSWFYGMNCNSIPLKNKRIKPSLKRLYIQTVKTKLLETFNDDSLKRLNNMLLILQGTNESGGIQRMGLKTYNSVFERLIKWALDNVGDLSKYNPKAEWSDGERLSPLRLDALRIENKCACIIDAKFYQNSLPQTSDIAKQITYGENLFINSCDDEFDKNQIFNFFIAPRSCLNDKLLIDSGKTAKGLWRQNNHSYETVCLLYIDLKELLLSWNLNNKSGVVSDFKIIMSNSLSI